MKKRVYSVGQINTYIKNMFAQDFLLEKLHIKGEISNCKYHSSGHIYFSLKDSSGTIAAVMFAGNRKNGLKFRMRDGDHVVATGSVEVYERDGRYQLYAREIELDGAGALFLRFEALKKELAEMGMFAPEYKQPIPKYIRTLGIVTAPTGAAIQDMINISHRRNPCVQLILYPALVQGDGAAQSIVNGIHALEQLGVDTIIVGRGGGSIEDLWAFNEEIVARAIFECSIPIISAVGHETDTTIADYTADMRAPTPSAAAELAVYDIRELEGTLLSLQLELNRNITDRLERAEERVRQYANRLKLLSPVNQLNEKRQTAADLEEKLRMRMEQQVMQRRHELELLAERLESLSPLKKLSQGYAFVTDKNGQGICDAEKVQTGDTLKIHMLNGKVTAKVEEVEQEVL